MIKHGTNNTNRRSIHTNSQKPSELNLPKTKQAFPNDIRPTNKPKSYKRWDNCRRAQASAAGQQLPTEASSVNHFRRELALLLKQLTQGLLPS